MFTFFSINNFSRYFIIAFLLFFIFIIILSGHFGWQSKELDNVDTSDEIILARLSRAMAELAALKSQNEELRHLIQSYIPLELKPNSDYVQHNNNNNDDVDKSDHRQLDQEYELSRRKLKSDLVELWNFIQTNTSSNTQHFAKELKDSMLYDLDVISRRDESERTRQLKQLSEYVQKKIHQLQNPENCKTARKIVCNLNKGCGFGCQIHHLVYCTIISMATGRTLILNSESWRYVNRHYARSFKSKPLWDMAFKPLSNSCLSDSGSSRGNWGKEVDIKDIQVIDLPIVDSLRPRPDYLPLTIPEEISSQLITLHGAPIVWFIGQILQFLMRPSAEIETFIDEAKRKFSFHAPIVGLHVRRTDKINTEAAFHSLSEYMTHVEAYFDQLDLFNQRKDKLDKVERVVYLATDDPSVWKKEVKIFEQKGYKFIGDYEISSTAGVGRRYSFDSLKNIILDVWLLSETDYLVCTFSSQVCRLAYELMQSKKAGIDKSADFYSLDDIYYFGGQGSHNQIATLDHTAKSKDEIHFHRGDLIGIAGNHWNGYSKGLNRVTQQTGLYPGFKTVEKIDTAKFAIFQT